MEMGLFTSGTAHAVMTGIGAVPWRPFLQPVVGTVSCFPVQKYLGVPSVGRKHQSPSLSRYAMQPFSLTYFRPPPCPLSGISSLEATNVPRISSSPASDTVNAAC